MAQNANEDWMNRKWRPAMGWMYMTVCMMDFVFFPVLWSMLQSHYNGQVTSQWQPLTLQGAGLFHMAMGAVLGLAAWGRTQEKINATTTPSMPATSGLPSSIPTAMPTPMAIDPTNRITRND